jgi:chromosome partitioning protein
VTEKLYKLAVVNNKGGIGKTSTVLGLASSIRKIQPNAKILIVDSDEQSCIKTSFSVKLGQAEGGLAAVLMDGIQPEKLAFSVRDNLDIILSGGRAMREFEKNYAKTPNADLIVSECFKKLFGYNYVIFDTPPAFSLLTSNILNYCNYLIIPCELDLFGYVGVKNTITFIDNLREHFRKKNIPLARVLGVLPTMYDERRNMDLDILQDLENFVYEKKEIKDNDAIVFSPIRQDIKVKTSQVKRKLLHEFAPTSRAAEDYLNFTKVVLGQIGALPKEDTDANLKRNTEISLSATSLP